MHKQPAQMLVEFAIATLVLIPLVLGLLGFGRVFYAYVDVTNLARYGAKLAISLPATTTCSAAQTQIPSQVISAWRAEHPATSDPTVALTCPTTSAAAARTVVVTRAFATHVPSNTFLAIPTSITLSASATLPLLTNP